jgi:hypothetical protein
VVIDCGNYIVQSSDNQPHVGAGDCLPPHLQLSAPKIVTHAGQKIEPMSEDALVQTETLKINNKKKVKAGKWIFVTMLNNLNNIC